FGDGFADAPENPPSKRESSIDGSTDRSAPYTLHPHSPRSWAGAEEPFLHVEVWRPLQAARASEAEIGAERVAHGVDESVGAGRCEAVLPPDVEHLDAAFVPVDTRLDPADKAVP